MCFLIHIEHSLLELAEGDSQNTYLCCGVEVLNKVPINNTLSTQNTLWQKKFPHSHIVAKNWKILVKKNCLAKFFAFATNCLAKKIAFATKKCLAKFFAFATKCGGGGNALLYSHKILPLMWKD